MQTHGARLATETEDTSLSSPFFSGSLLLNSRNSDPGSQSRLYSPHPTTIRALRFLARRVQHFLPSSTRVEWCLHTLLNALGAYRKGGKNDVQLSVDKKKETHNILRSMYYKYIYSVYICKIRTYSTPNAKCIALAECRIPYTCELRTVEPTTTSYTAFNGSLQTQ